MLRLRSPRVRRLLLARNGVSTVEYGFIAALIVLVMLVAFRELAGITVAMWNDISTQVTTAR